MPCCSLPSNGAEGPLFPLDGRRSIEEAAKCPVFETGGRWAACGVRGREFGGVLWGRTRPLVSSSPGPDSDLFVSAAGVQEDGVKVSE